MTMVRIALFGIALLALCGCQTMISTTPFRPTSSIGNVVPSPVPTGPQVARVGDSLLIGQTEEMTLAFDTTAPLTASPVHKGRQFTVMVPAAHFYLCGAGPGGGYFCSSEPLQVNSRKADGGLFLARNSTTAHEVFWRNQYAVTPLTGNVYRAALEAPVPVNVAARSNGHIAPGTIRQELVYNGLSGGVLHVMYREFTDEGLARPSYYSDLSFDYRPGMSIRYQSVELRVQQATNEQINYTVVSGFAGPSEAVTAP